MLYTQDSATWRVCLLALCMPTAFFYDQEKIQDPGSSGELHLGTYRFRPCNAALLLEAGSTVAALEACELLH